MTAILDPLIRILSAILETAHDFSGLGYGWSIVILTVIVRVLLLPLTYKQMRAMRAMQALQPQLKELQEKYKSDRQLLNQKMMEFYKENSFNPMGSCLPLLLQMPVFFALFYLLKGEAESGKFTAETWLWIRDWGADLPRIAENITQFDLPLLLLYVASQFVTSLQMVTKDPTQRMMMLSMPVVIGVIMFFGEWPAGLFIYWFTSNLWTIAQQFAINKVFPAPTPAPAAAAVETGGTSGPSRQRKKPKAKGGKR